MARSFWVRAQVGVIVTVADDAIDAAVFRVTERAASEGADDPIEPWAHLAALDAFQEWARVADAERIEVLSVIETDREGVPLQIG